MQYANQQPKQYWEKTKQKCKPMTLEFNIDIVFKKVYLKWNAVII